MGKKHKNKNRNSYEQNVLSTFTSTTNKTETKSTGYSWGSYYSSKSKNYDYKGKKNQTKFPAFVNYCKQSQESLKATLMNELIKAGYTDIIIDDGYIYAKGTIPVLLTAHMDTVHKENVKDFYEYYDTEKKQHIISSPQGIGGDDRCGCYMITEIIKTHKCSVLFCEDEEIGGIGSRKFCRTELINELCDLKYLIELDRANETDAVFYDCENPDFTSFIETNTGFAEAYGSFSDISNLSPDCRVASVNLSCGYHNAHTTSEYVVVEEMLNTIEVVKNLLEVECESFEYIEAAPLYGYGYGSRKFDRYDIWDDDCWDYNWYGKDYKNYTGNTDSSNVYNYKTESKDTQEERSLLIYVYDSQVDDVVTYVANAETEEMAFYKFFRDNPSFCYNDVYDFVFYEDKVFDDGWYSYLL